MQHPGGCASFFSSREEVRQRAVGCNLLSKYHRSCREAPCHVAIGLRMRAWMCRYCSRIAASQSIVVRGVLSRAAAAQGRGGRVRIKI
eukprot:scaffold294_cov131-Isochrysis_galbana.AAC.9